MSEIIYSGRRRHVTRKSGFTSHIDSTGGEYKEEFADKIMLKAGLPVSFIFEFSKPDKDLYAGYGGYYHCKTNLTVDIHNPNYEKNSNKHFDSPDLSKFGSMWKVQKGDTIKPVKVSFQSSVDSELSIYEFTSGLIWSAHFDNARDSIMKAMHDLSPEGNIYIEKDDVRVSGDFQIFEGDGDMISLKSCNRCARFLPINIHNERNHLSFSNHCVARAPCTHKGFGLLRNIDTDEFIELKYGYQLECRFCKKYEVNGPLNPQRTASQLKEDGQRRRNFELLLTELYNASPQLSYRTITKGRELATDVWNKFGRKCFHCGVPIKSEKKMHLDHTRPLALLWPLDKTATALCSTCNTQKRDRSPKEFYSEDQIRELSKITGLDTKDLESSEPNHEALDNY